MLDRSLRPRKTTVLAPVTARLRSVPALALTGIGLVVGLGAAVLAALGLWLPALLAWLANRAIDGIDGEVARASGTASDRGGYLDLAADATVYAAIPLGVATGIGTGGAWTAAAVLLGAFYVNIVTVTTLAAIQEKRAAGAAARGEPTSITLPVGLIEGTETIILFALILAAPSFAVWSMALMAAAVAVTAVGRVASAWPTLAADPADHPPASTPAGRS